VLDGSGAISYLQYYCWQNSGQCDTSFLNLLQCLTNECTNCDNNLPMTTTGAPVATNSSAFSQNGCSCLFDVCWNTFSACFLDSNCWNLFFGTEPGYGLTAIFQSLIDNSSLVLPTPGVAQQRIQDVYCAGKDCTTDFWNVWSCLMDPIFLGPSYYADCPNNAQYWQGQTTGCGLGDVFYTDLFEALNAPCLSNCIGFGNDCFTDTLCSAQFGNAIADYADTSDGSLFKSNYLQLCGSQGKNCSTKYDNLANCVYVYCGSGTGTLPGSQNTTCTKVKKIAVMKNGFFAFILALLLLVVSM